ncbi:MAG: hypothetical protein GY895_21310 [Phycisphaera sp.]|nr:hypothetical protein [Phycisphaera sp.]
MSTSCRKRCSHRSRGASRSWIVFSIAVLVATGLVVLFVQNLPAPPRYDPLTVTPGSSVPDRSAFGMTLVVGEGSSEVRRSWRTNDLEIDGRPMLPADLVDDLPPGKDWRLVARLDLQRSRPTVVGLRFLLGDVDLKIQAYESDIASLEARGREESVLDDILVPAGSSTLVFDILPAGPDPFVRGGWVDEAGEERPLSDLSRSRGR